MNRCSDCDNDFASTEAFDSHRIGVHAYTHAQGLAQGRSDGRRCRTVEEMTDSGWQTDLRGRWVHPRELRRRASRRGDSPYARDNGWSPRITSDLVSGRATDAITAPHDHEGAA